MYLGKDGSGLSSDAGRRVTDHAAVAVGQNQAVLPINISFRELGHLHKVVNGPLPDLYQFVERHLMVEEYAGRLSTELTVVATHSNQALVPVEVLLLITDDHASCKRDKRVADIQRF